MQDYSLQLFEPHLGSTFQVLINGQSALDLTLTEVEDLTVEDRFRSDAIRSQPFSLIFTGPRNPVFPQGNYEIGHTQLNAMTIFIVPIGPAKQSPQSMQYQAIFN